MNATTRSVLTFTLAAFLSVLVFSVEAYASDRTSIIEPIYSPEESAGIIEPIYHPEDFIQIIEPIYVLNDEEKTERFEGDVYLNRLELRDVVSWDDGRELGFGLILVQIIDPIHTKTDELEFRAIIEPIYIIVDQSRKISIIEPIHDKEASLDLF